MNRVFWAIAVIFGILHQAVACGQQIEWMHDLESAQHVAAEQDKLMLLHFSAEWCRPCKQLETFVFSSSTVSKAINEKLVAVHIDTDIHPELVKQFAIEEIPTDIVLTAKGRVLAKRRSPKDTSNYLRMIRSLPVATTANELQNVEMAQKIDRVVNASKKELFNPNENDFAAKKPRHEQPAPSNDALKLSEKLQTRQVDHETNSFVPRPSAFTTSSGSGPQRVINDQFFVEKSETEKMSKSAEQAVAKSEDFKPENFSTQKRSMQLQPRAASQQVASAKIENPFHPKQSKNEAETETAARFMTKDFVKPKSLNSNPVKKFKPTSTVASQKLVPKLSAKFESQKDDRNNAMLKPNLADQSTAAGVSGANSRKLPNFALGGRCPVTLLRDGKWMKGNSNFGCIHRGRVYIFGDAEKLKLFESDPDKYSPVLAGYDPVEFHETGNLVDGQEKHGVFMGKSGDQKIVLFSSQETRAKFQSEPQKYMSTIRTALQSTGKMR